MSRTKQPGRGWAYAGAIMGGAVSIAANIAHSFLPPLGAAPSWEPEIGAVVGAIVWPVFLFIAVEILVRTLWPRGWSWHLLRWAGLLPIAGVAAFVSYRHLSGLLAHYGEEPLVYYIGPLAVDGLMIMATAALVAGKHATRQKVAASVESVAVPVPLLTQTRVAETVAPHQRVPETGTPLVTAPTLPIPAAGVIDASSVVPATSAPTVPARRAEVSPKEPAPSTIDIAVTALDAPVPSSFSPGLLDRARKVVEFHRENTGADITPAQLGKQMRVGIQRANQILAVLAAGNAPVPATPVNGSPVARSTT